MRGTVGLTVPAEPAFAVVVRTMVMTTAAECGLDGDRVQDARLLSDEFFNCLQALADPTATLTCQVQAADGSLNLRAWVDASHGELPSPQSMQWRVFNALGQAVSGHRDGAILHLEATVGSHE